MLREIKNIFHTELDTLYGKEEVSSFFYLVIEHYFDLERFVLALQPDLLITKAQEPILFKALFELKLEKPIQHILCTSHFMDLDFKVNEQVLIPRPETEELVRWILDDVKHRNQPLTLLDIGTGSGCIPIALAKNISNATITALDISSDALKIAKENAKTHFVTIDFFQADILKLEFEFEFEFELEFDVIVSNPPYVRELEKESMHSNVIDHEPKIALFVPDANPLQFYKAIVKFASDHLKAKGCLYLEINQYLGTEMITLLEEYGFSSIELRKDMFGNDRMLKGSKL
jgi:release factor glutamine methyltransferase